MLQHYFAVAKYLFESPFHNMQSKPLAPEVHHRTAVQGSGRFHINHGTCTLITLDRLVASPHLRQWRVAVIAATLFGGALYIFVSLGILPELKLRQPRQVSHKVTYGERSMTRNALVGIFSCAGGWPFGTC
jgi:hypothetical protein